MGRAKVIIFRTFAIRDPTARLRPGGIVRSMNTPSSSVSTDRLVRHLPGIHKRDPNRKYCGINELRRISAARFADFAGKGNDTPETWR
jgi:hypothetical protein